MKTLEQKQALTDFIEIASDEAITKLYLTYAEIRGFERCDDSELLQASKEWIEGLTNNDVMELYLKNVEHITKEEAEQKLKGLTGSNYKIK